VEFELPPLRDRLVDLPDLYRALVGRINVRLGKKISVEPRQDVLDLLGKHRWPGNIRELEHTLERAMVIGRANVLTPSTIRVENPTDGSAPGVAIPGLAAQVLEGTAGWASLRDVRGDVRRSVLMEVISILAERQRMKPTSAQLAKLIGTSEGNMRRILSEAGIHLRSRS
jgi:DNA-binding NtrC family response regulator